MSAKQRWTAILKHADALATEYAEKDQALYVMAVSARVQAEDALGLLATDAESTNLRAWLSNGIRQVHT